MPVHQERHRTTRIGWLRAAVLGANDGIVSTSSLVVGVASASAGPRAVVVAGVAGLVAGALSMAAGEYVSVSSQADVERADRAREKGELDREPAKELDELTHIYVDRGLEPATARVVAEQLTARGALTAHLRDELGLFGEFSARPLQAALASAATFVVGGVVPLGAAVLAPAASVSWIVAVVSLICLAALGALAAKTGGASVVAGTARVTVWGAVAMFVTAVVGRWFGHVI